MPTITAVMLTLCVALLATSGARALDVAEQAQPTPKRQPATRRAQPTEAERARLTRLVERQRAWVERTSAELSVTIDKEREQFRRRQAAELDARNQQTRAEIARHLQAARAESRQLEIQAEAAKLLGQSRTASAADRAQIDRRAAQLIEELERLRAAAVRTRKVDE